jgi:Flp pilus assembly protein TadG
VERLRRFLCDRPGQSMIGMALVLPIPSFVLIGAADMGHAFS